MSVIPQGFSVLGPDGGEDAVEDVEDSELELPFDDECVEELLGERWKEVAAALNIDREGETDGVVEFAGEGVFFGDEDCDPFSEEDWDSGAADEGFGNCIPFLTTIKERCSRFLASRPETYSSAGMSSRGSCLISRSDCPASSGADMSVLAMGIAIVS
jgi:hypothetical protein